MTHRMLSAVEANIQRLSGAQTDLAVYGTGLYLPSPTTQNEIVDGLNAFSFRGRDGSYERPNIPDRLQELDQATVLSLSQQQERAALTIMSCAQAVTTLFADGHRHHMTTGGVVASSIRTRANVLSVEEFAVHRPTIEMSKAVTGLARLQAEREPSPESWLIVSMAGLNTQLALYRAQAAAEKRVQSEPSHVKFQRGLAPFLKSLVRA